MNRAIRLACLLLALGWGATAQAQYLLTSGSGGELQIGTGLPLPIGPAGIFKGGMTSVNGGTSCGAGPGGCAALGGPSPDGPGTAYWPPVLVPPNMNISTMGMTSTNSRVIHQDFATAMGGAMRILPSALTKSAAGAPVPIAVFTTNPAVFQVATTISYAWPPSVLTIGPFSEHYTLSNGGGPGPGAFVFGAHSITYSGGVKSFGGAAQFEISAGPGAPGGRVPLNTMGVPAIATVWINAFAGAPTTATMIAIVGASIGGSASTGLAQAGAPVASPPNTTMFGPVASGVGLINQTVLMPAMVTCCTVTPMGGIPSSIAVAAPFPSNMVTGSKGFPWTTGFITVAAAAVPPELFYLSGTDMRVAGVGNISLVSGSLSDRALSKANANRGWLSLTLALPEPTAALGATGALMMLGLCHGLVRRRSR